MVYRVYVEKQAEYAVEAAAVRQELTQMLGIRGLTGLRILNRYDVEGISQELFEATIPTVFSEPPVDTVYTELPTAEHVLAVEYLPGQFDQRANSAAECVQLISQGERPVVCSAKVYLMQGQISQQQYEAAKRHLINPVEAREAALEVPDTLRAAYPSPPPVAVLSGFTEMGKQDILTFIDEYALAMDAADLEFCREYFKAEGRQPTITELRMIDTYWSDHCRHTTFGTILQDIVIEDEKTKRSYEIYKKLREELYANRPDKPQTLMDIGTIGAKAIRARGGLKNLDESDEVNACSVEIPVDNNGDKQQWLLLFKNETHNHPTEIEPFGGAATCIGGAIRDPLANRGYVFGAMRVTGAGNPLAPMSETLPGKLPQRKICKAAADGYSSYGNQIGLATGQVTELYHPGYIAKRMEIGAVLGAVPCDAVRREVPQAGDAVLLIGGRTGRDGCGGATGSSKAHKTESLESCGAEVQKGNAPQERKIQRLFRNREATRLIRRCNDFGAGGVSVAIGELADGVKVNLDAVPKKYDGLDGTELAISESQERMAVVVAKNDVPQFMQMAAEENLEVTQVAEITAAPRLVMCWQGSVVADLSREFLNSNGAERHANVRVAAMPNVQLEMPQGDTLAELFMNMAQDLNRCSQKGLGEQFDSTIGAASVLMPFGGRQQLTPAQAMVMKIPVDGETTTCAGMAFGFDPYVSEQNPHDGSYIAVLHSVAKLLASGFALEDITLSFQEYFERLRSEPLRWGKPFAALLGALRAQLELGVGAIGGKDSMSGSFEELDVPPTLVSFAVGHADVDNIVPNEFQLPLSRVALLRPKTDGGIVPQAESFKQVAAQLQRLIEEKKALAVYAVGAGGVAEALFKMCLGNKVGFELEDKIDAKAMFAPAFGSFVVELDGDADEGELLGYTAGQYAFKTVQETVELMPIQQAWQQKLEPVYQSLSPSFDEEVRDVRFEILEHERIAPAVKLAKPRALIPVFPGTNCEYDTARALHRAGGEADIFVVRNLTPKDVTQSANELARRIGQSQMVVLPGGFSGGDEPEGSAKLICALFRAPQVEQAVHELLQKRDGLMLGICNGFQALVKLGLLPYGQIAPLKKDSPTLTFNAIGRHQSMLVNTKIASNLSPWFAMEKVGAVHTIAISHGEGRFVASGKELEELAGAGQIAAQYVDLSGAPTMDVRYNPNASCMAIEAITSPDGRILGKMGHTERAGEGLYKNVQGNKFQRLFEGGVGYYLL